MLLFASNISAQNQFELSYSPFFTDATFTNNVSEINNNQKFQVKFLHNHFFVETGFEAIHFSENAIVIDQITHSKAFPRKGNSYELSYASFGLGLRTHVFKGFTLDNSFHFDLLVNKHFSAAEHVINSTTLTTNQSGEESVTKGKTSFQNRLQYAFPVSKKISMSLGFVLQTNFVPMVDEDFTNDYFLSNKTVDINHQLGMTFSFIYVFD